MATATSRLPARDRLLTAADELMFVDGVVLTPVDVILRKAGTAPATLYAHFGNKDGLIAAALERRLSEWTAAWDQAIAQARTPVGRLLAIFPALRSYQRDRLNERWCAFSGTAAATHHTSEQVAAMLRAEDELLHSRTLSLAVEIVGRADGRDLAEQVVHAYLGTLTGMLRGDHEVAIRRGEQIAQALVDRATREG